ncbi:hypothetical protein F0562_034428 [Nyssa sinensis]|uniref:Uncharacterized protein n=1 Tax=Nyssa sinensis TaxID=561372 RepID=A0A5J5AIJ0_9ASTE|nr:hypothetical protein F0562_034428 [Nyssa sinensis]
MVEGRPVGLQVGGVQCPIRVEIWEWQVAELNVKISATKLLGVSDRLINGPSAQRTVTLARFPKATTYDVGEHDCKGKSQSSSTDLKLHISAENENRPRRCTLTGHSHFIQGVILSSDIWFAFSGSYEGELRLWDVAAETTAYCFVGHTKDVISVIFSKKIMLSELGRRVVYFLKFVISDAVDFAASSACSAMSCTVDFVASFACLGVSCDVDIVASDACFISKHQRPPVNHYHHETNTDVSPSRAVAPSKALPQPRPSPSPLTTTPVTTAQTTTTSGSAA